MKNVKQILLVMFVALLSSLNLMASKWAYKPITSDADLTGGGEIVIVYQSGSNYYAYRSPENVCTAATSANRSASGYYFTWIDVTSCIKSGVLFLDSETENHQYMPLTCTAKSNTYLTAVKTGGKLCSSSGYMNVGNSGVTDGSTYGIRKFNLPGAAGAAIELTNPASTSYKYIVCDQSNLSKNTTIGSATNITLKVYKRTHFLSYENSDYVTITNATQFGEGNVTVAAPQGAALKDASFSSFIDMTKFEGWATQKGSSTVVYNTGATINLANQDVTLYPVYKFTKSFTVKFQTDDHSYCDQADIVGVLPVTMPQVEVEDGYMFQGWSFVDVTDPLNPKVYIMKPGDVFPSKTAASLTCNATFTAITNPVFSVLDWRGDTMLIEYPSEVIRDSFYLVGGTAKGGYDVNTRIEKLATGVAGKLDSAVYRVILPSNMASSQSNAGKQVKIKFMSYEAGTYNLINDATATVPYFVNGQKKNITGMGFSKETATKVDLIICNGGDLTIDENGWKFRHIYIYPGSKLTVADGVTLEIRNNLYMRSGYLSHKQPFNDQSKSYEYVYPQVLVNGSITMGGKPIYEMVINGGAGSGRYMYNYAAPGDVNLKDITYFDGDSIKLGHFVQGVMFDSIKGGSLYMEYYDGARRAQGLKSDAETAWKDLSTASPTKLNASTGYTIACNPQRKGAIKGRQMYTIVRFPMTLDLSTAQGSKGVAVQPYPAAKDNDAGWNLIACPFTCNYGGALGLATNGIGLLVQDDLGQYHWDGTLRYIVVPSNDGQSYQSSPAYSTTMPSFKNFFIQIGAEDPALLAFTLAQGSSAPRINRIRAKGMGEIDLPNEPMPELTGTMTGLILSNGMAQDNMGMLIGEEFTTAYEINADLAKMRMPQQVAVYALSGTDELAFIAINDSVAAGTTQLGYMAPAAGEYTFTFDRQYNMSDVDGLYLTDNDAKRTINLLLEDYTFTTTKGQNNSRFTLSCELAKAPTAVDNAAGQQVIATSQNGNLMLSALPFNAKVYVYDAAGRLAAQSVATANSERFALPAGAYNVRVVATDGVEVVRAIVK